MERIDRATAFSGEKVLKGDRSSHPVYPVYPVIARTRGRMLAR
jgi:hypothetical protein